MKRNNMFNNVDNNYDYRIISLEQPLSIAAEAYKRVKVAIEFSRVDKPIKVIQICSAVQGEGKTTVALNLAATYLNDNKKVIVVDLDFRRPKIHRTIKVENKDGIVDVLAGNINLEKAIKKGKTGLSILNRGSETINPTALLNSDNIKELFSRLREMYDYVIVDCPPILAVSDAAIISKLCDGCVYVVSQNKSEKNAAKEAVSLLRRNNVDIIGCVFTGITRKNSKDNRKYEYYYHDEYSDK